MQLSDYQLAFIPKWFINNHSDYYFCIDNKLRNNRTRRVIKKSVKGGYSTGYRIDGKFILLKDLKLLLERCEPIKNRLEPINESAFCFDRLSAILD